MWIHLYPCVLPISWPNTIKTYDLVVLVKSIDHKSYLEDQPYYYKYVHMTLDYSNNLPISISEIILDFVKDGRAKMNIEQQF